MVTSPSGDSVFLIGGWSKDKDAPMSGIYELHCVRPECQWNKLSISLENPMYNFAAITVPESMLPNVLCS